MQRGNIYRKGNAWFGRWRQDEIVKGADGLDCVKRIQRTKKLCDYSDRFRTVADVKPLLDEKLRPLNQGQQSPLGTMTVADFGDKHFLPWAEAEKRRSTYSGYLYNWKRYLRPRLQKISVRDFRCVDATKLLAAVAQTYNINRKTLQHLKALMSNVFSRAMQDGARDGVNPITGAGISNTVREAVDPRHYTVQETVTMLSGLEGMAKLAVALMFFAGLRPGEASALRWSDYDSKTKTITVNQSRWRNYAPGETKTKSSKAPIPVPQLLVDLLDAAPRVSQWVLTSPTGKWVDLHNLAARVIRPALAKCSVCHKDKHQANGHEYTPFGIWAGFYAGRRGCATMATSLDSSLAAMSLLRHANVQTTAAYYIKRVPEDARRAVGKIDALFAEQTVTQ